MTNEETKIALQFLSVHWSQPWTDDHARAYGIKIAKCDFAQTMAALDKLHDTEDWRPSWATIKKMIDPPAASNREGLQRALSAVLIYPPGQRDQNVSDAASATVRRLGGWRVIGQMNPDERQWDEKRWASAWDEIADEVAAGRPMSELAGHHTPLVITQPERKPDEAKAKAPPKMDLDKLPEFMRKMFRSAE